MVTVAALQRQNVLGFVDLAPRHGRLLKYPERHIAESSRILFNLSAKIDRVFAWMAVLRCHTTTRAGRYIA